MITYINYSNHYYATFSFSAGVGRTGTFITLDAMMERLKERDDLNIFEFVTEMRTRRKQMVQTMVSTLYSFYFVPQ